MNPVIDVLSKLARLQIAIMQAEATGWFRSASGDPSEVMNCELVKRVSGELVDAIDAMDRYSDLRRREYFSQEAKDAGPPDESQQ